MTRVGKSSRVLYRMQEKSCDPPRATDSRWVRTLDSTIGRLGRALPFIGSKVLHPLTGCTTTKWSVAYSPSLYHGSLPAP